MTGAGGTFYAGMDLNQLNTGGRADEDELTTAGGSSRSRSAGIPRL